MNNETQTDTTEVEKKEVDEEVEEEVAEESVEETEETTTEDETESKKDIEIDYDAEMEKEKKGRPDPQKAKEAFEKRESRREDEPKFEEGDKPLTRKELDAILSQERKINFEIRAMQIARGLSTSDKEAMLIVEKWKNRTFPHTLSLDEQIEEAYAITHRKRLIGERNEALRALKSRPGVNSDAASSHRDEPVAGEPKMSPQDRMALTAAGFAWNGKGRRWEKRLSNGNLLIRDAGSPQTRMVRK